MDNDENVKLKSLNNALSGLDKKAKNLENYRRWLSQHRMGEDYIEVVSLRKIVEKAYDDCITILKKAEIPILDEYRKEYKK